MYTRGIHAQHQLGELLLAEPFFWPEKLWISAPLDFKSQTVQGKGYEAEADTGRELWKEVEERLRLRDAASIAEETATLAAIESYGVGKPQSVFAALAHAGNFKSS